MAASISAKPAPRGDAHAAPVSSNKRLRRPDHEEKPEVKAGYIHLPGKRVYQDLVFFDKGFQEYLKLGHDAGGQFVGGLLEQKVVACAVHFQHGVKGGGQL